MLLTELTEALVAHLNSSPENWAGEGIVAKAELDPSLCLRPGLGVYVVPVFTQYNIDGAGTRPRREMVAVNEIQYCTLIISQVFQDLPSDTGVANWNEAKTIINTRERAEKYLLKFGSSKLTLSSVESNPIEEVELDNRNFVSLTVFGYQQTSCVSQYELDSLSSGSRGVSEQQRIMASMKSQLLSGRKPDR